MFQRLLPFFRRRPAALATPRAAAVQTHDLSVREIDSQTGALLLPGGMRRHILRMAAEPFANANEAQAQAILSNLAAAFNGLRSTVTLLTWGEPTGVQAQRAALQERLASTPQLTGGRRALAESHLALLDRLHTRQAAPGQPRRAAPRTYTYLLTVDGTDATALERDVTELCTAFRATRLDAEAALVVLRQGWRGQVLFRPGGRLASDESWTVRRVDTQGRTLGAVLRLSAAGTRLEGK